MKLIVITKQRSLYGIRLLNVLKNEGIEVAAVVVIKQSLAKQIRMFKSVCVRIGFWDTLMYAIAMGAKEVFGYLYTKLTRCLIVDYHKLAHKVLWCDTLNTEQTAQSISDETPEVLVLGQSGIVKERILQIPRFGTLNAHPGILPEYRGLDAFVWAAYKNDFDHVGITVHWVNRQVDGGNILVAKRYDFRGDERFGDFEDRLYGIGIKEMVQIIQSFTHKVPAGEPQECSRAHLYFKMPRRFLRIASQNFARHLHTVRSKGSRQ